ncbi:LPXTG cell wall anchor domain-containing protein [Listeria immobilis]|uniref:LPXTG cell wall anchor domain-containing protein n=1 Tax=Listeria immobilis TaxID=2713502 RepID=UPI0035D5D654
MSLPKTGDTTPWNALIMGVLLSTSALVMWKKRSLSLQNNAKSEKDNSRENHLKRFSLLFLLKMTKIDLS